ncbi:MAG: protein kinase [Candidatus Sericytochromatia bacterium]|nr:protein kinase [Candidatus Sericytochromatia bacterium]
MLVPYPGAELALDLALPDGTRLQRLVLENLLGTGGFAQVWEVSEPESKQAYTLKIFQGVAPDSVLAERIRTEAAIRIPSSRVVQPLGLQELPHGVVVIVFEYLAATPLDQVLARGVLRPAQLRQVVQDILEGVAVAHARNIIHRDLKPDNILLTSDHRAHIIDFGIARLEDQNLTQVGDLLGTHEFMAPEQWLSQPVDARSDIYALGLLFYALLAGQSIWTLNSWSLLEYMAFVQQEPPPYSLLDSRPLDSPDWPALAAVMRRMACLEPAQRYASVAEVQQVLGLPLTHARQPLVPALQGFPFLSVESGPNQGCQTPLNLSENESRVLGRTDFAGHDTSISRSHLKILRRDNQYYLQDCGSKNGTLLGGQRLTPHAPPVPIAPHDRIKAGELFLVFRINPSGEES